MKLGGKTGGKLGAVMSSNRLKCPKCKELRAVGEFPFNKAQAKGKSYYCKYCCSRDSTQRKYRLEAKCSKALAVDNIAFDRSARQDLREVWE